MQYIRKLQQLFELEVEVDLFVHYLAADRLLCLQFGSDEFVPRIAASMFRLIMHHAILSHKSYLISHNPSSYKSFIEIHTSIGIVFKFQYCILFVYHIFIFFQLSITMIGSNDNSSIVHFDICVLTVPDSSTQD